MRRWLITAIALQLGSGSVLAAEWRLELYGGKFFPAPADLMLERPAPGDHLTFRKLNWADRSFDSPVYYGYRIARFAEKRGHLGFELEFLHAKIYADPESRLEAAGRLGGLTVRHNLRLGEYVQRFNISHGLNFLLLNLVHRTFITGKSSSSRRGSYLLFRAGAGPMICHTESTIGGQPLEQYELGGIGFQAGAGAVLHLSERFYLPLEYKYTFSRLRGLRVDQGNAGLNVGGSHLTAGAGFRL